MQFEWDKKKNELNIIKHGISFFDAEIIFGSPMFIKLIRRKDIEEHRWIGLGLLVEIVVVVIFTKREQKIRIISIRKASKKERVTYYEQSLYRSN
ncbi:MAG: BrnT family toxin [Melioribacteraceae bacterium]